MYTLSQNVVNCISNVDRSELGLRLLDLESLLLVLISNHTYLQGKLPSISKRNHHIQQAVPDSWLSLITQMAPKVRAAAPAEASLGPNVGEGELVFGVAQ